MDEMHKLAHTQADIFTEHITAVLFQSKSSLVILKKKEKNVNLTLFFPVLDWAQ